MTRRRTKRNLPEAAIGQRWAVRDDRYEGWRYLTVTSIEDGRVTATGGKRGITHIRADRFGRGWRWSFCGHDGPGILPPFSRDGSVTLGCYPFGQHATVLPLEHWLDVAGYTTVTRDGEQVWALMSTEKRLAHLELRARETPGDWRLRQESAMSERLYQRQDHGWVLVAIGMGFA